MSAQETENQTGGAGLDANTVTGATADAPKSDAPSVADTAAIASTANVNSPASTSQASAEVAGLPASTQALTGDGAAPAQIVPLEVHAAFVKEQSENLLERFKDEVGEELRLGENALGRALKGLEQFVEHIGTILSNHQTSAGVDSEGANKTA